MSQIITNNAGVSSSHHTTINPAIIELTPLSETTRFVEEGDITAWRSYLDQLVGKAFIFGEMASRVFRVVVVDYAVKLVNGAQYDVVYEDNGMNEVHIIDPNTLLELVADAELISTPVFFSSFFTFSF